MKIKFIATNAAPKSYSITGSLINSIDISDFVAGSIFVGNEETKASGIFDIKWNNGELNITLGQGTKAYQIHASSHDWAEGDWIDAADYDSEQCYVKATNPQALALIDAGQAEYFRDTDGAWTVRMIEALEQEPAA